MIRRMMFGGGVSEALCRCHASLSTLHTLPTRTKGFVTVGNDPASGSDVWENVYKQEVPRTMEEMTNLLQREVVSPPDPFLLKVAIVGVPNCGKSTLINKLMGWRVCSSSRKVHTTQVNTRAVYNIGSTQLVFLDTPGLVTPQEVVKHKLQRNLLTEPELSLQEADLLAVVHDVSCQYSSSSLHSRLVRLLALHPTIPAVLVLNKVDILKTKRNLLHITQVLTEGFVGGKKFFPKTKKSSEINKKALLRRALIQDRLSAAHDEAAATVALVGGASTEGCIQHVETDQRTDSLLNTSNTLSHVKEKDILAGKVQLTEQQVQIFIEDRTSWPLFQDVFMISAKDGTGVDDFREYLTTWAQPRPWIFSPHVVTDQNPEDIALTTVREKFLDHFKEEIPYTLKFSIEYWDLSDTDLLTIIIKVQCSKKGLIRVLLGDQGNIIRKMAQTAEQDLRNTFRSEVRLRLQVVYDRSLKKRMIRR